MIPTTRIIVPHIAIWMVMGGLLPSLASAQQTAPSPQRTFASAVQLYNQRLYAEAMTAFEAYRSAYPEHAQAGQSLYLEATAALAQNRDREAIRLFKRFQRTRPTHPRAAEAQLSLAQYFLDEGDTNAARDQLQSIIDAPSSPAQAARALYLFGRSERDRGNLDQALRYFQRVRSEYPETDVAPAAFYALGATQVQLERYDAAAASFETLGQKFPESPFAQNLGTALAEVYYRLEQYEQAVTELRRRLDQLEGSPRARALFLLAEASNHLRNGEDAVVNYRRVIDEYPNTPYVGPAKYGLAWHYFRAKEHQQAAEAFSRVRREEDPPLSEPATYYEAVSRALAGAKDRAVELYQTVAEQQPDRQLAAESLFEAGLLRYQQQEYDAAAAFFRALVRDHPEAERVGDAYYWLGNAYLVDQSLDRALQAYNQATKRGSASDARLVEARFQKAWAQYEEGRYADAAPTFLSLAESNPDTPRGREALFWGADCHYQQGNYSRARSLFQRYVNENPNGDHSAAAQYALAWTYFKQNRFQPAAQRFRQFLDAYEGQQTDIPYDQDARLRLADSYFAMKQYEDAVEVYRRVGGQGADYALYQAGEALNYAGRPEEALRTLRRVTERYPDSRWHPEVLYRIGAIHFQTQEYESAVEAYQRFLDTYPEHRLAPEAQYGIGDSHYNSGQMEDAVQAYRAVLEDYPQSPTASEAASSIFFALGAAGQSDRAEELITSIAKQHPNANLEDRLRFQRAKAAYQSGNSEQALQLFQQFVRTSSTTSLLPETYYYLGLLYADDDAMTEAKNYLQQLVDQYPDSDVLPEGALRLGDLYMEEQAYTNAMETYNAAAESDAISDELRGQARYGQSMALLNLNRTEEARTILNRILEEGQGGPLQASARLGLARIYAEEGQIGQAQKLYRQVVEASDSEMGAEALFRLGELLRQQNSPRQAIQELDRMPTLFPGYPEWVAQSLLEQARAYEQIGQTGQAAQLYDQVAKKYPGTPFAQTAEDEREAL
jgi:TolA-binding protein